MALTALGACNKPRNWLITFTNLSAEPASCKVFTRLDGSSNAEVKDVKGSQPVTLLIGVVETVVHDVKVQSGGKDLPVTFTPDTKIVAGESFSITIGADGKVTTAVQKP